MAAAENDRDVLYFTFGDVDLRGQIYRMYQRLKNSNITVGKLYEILVSYNHDVIEQKVDQKLFEYIENCLAFQDDTDEEVNEVNEVTEVNEVSEAKEVNEVTESNSQKKQTVMTDFFTCKS